NVKSIATAEVGVGQDAEQANDNSQSQTAASDTGNISQTESLGDQDNTAAQEADENSAKAGSASVDILGLDNVTVDDSEVGSIAEAGSHIGQLAGQFNGNDQFQEANSNTGNIRQFQSNGHHDNSAEAESSEVDITAGDDVAISDSAVKSSATADPEITQEADQDNENLQNAQEPVEQFAVTGGDANISQTQSHGDQDNTAAQDA